MKLLSAIAALSGLALVTSGLAALIAVPLWLVAIESRELYALLLLVASALLIIRARGSRNRRNADTRRE